MRGKARSDLEEKLSTFGTVHACFLFRPTQPFARLPRLEAER
jgi:hypothetical protein